jgi:hypothetical protein
LATAARKGVSLQREGNMLKSHRLLSGGLRTYCPLRPGLGYATSKYLPMSAFVNASPPTSKWVVITSDIPMQRQAARQTRTSFFPR